MASYLPPNRGMRRRSEVGTRSAPAGTGADQQASSHIRRRQPCQWRPASRATRVPDRCPLCNQTLATATGGLLVALLIADRLVLWKRPRWLLRLPDEGVQIPIFGEMVLPLGSRLFRSLKYRPRVLDAGGGQGRIAQRFAAIATVEQRRHHLSLPVKVEKPSHPERRASTMASTGWC